MFIEKGVLDPNEYDITENELLNGYARTVQDIINSHGDTVREFMAHNNGSDVMMMELYIKTKFRYGVDSEIESYCASIKFLGGYINRIPKISIKLYTEKHLLIGKEFIFPLFTIYPKPEQKEFPFPVFMMPSKEDKK